MGVRVTAGGKFGGQSSGSSLLLDAPWYVFWPEAVLWAGMEGAIATMFAVGHTLVFVSTQSLLGYLQSRLNRS